MKINIVLVIISAVVAGLSAFGFYAASAGLVIAIGAGLTMFLTLCGLLALSMTRPGMANIRVVSALFFAAFLVVHIIFIFVGVSAAYFIVAGILLALYVLISYLILRALRD